MISTMAYCIMTEVPDTVEDRQCYLVGGLSDLLQGTPQEERDLTVYPKETIPGDEGCAWTTLAEPQNLKSGHMTHADRPRTQRATDICVILGPGEQVTIQVNLA